MPADPRTLLSGRKEPECSTGWEKGSDWWKHASETALGRVARSNEETAERVAKETIQA